MSTTVDINGPAPAGKAARMLEAARRSAVAAETQIDRGTQRALIRCAAKYIQGAADEVQYSEDNKP
jgi:hypothetical protein